MFSPDMFTAPGPDQHRLRASFRYDPPERERGRLPRKSAAASVAAREPAGRSRRRPRGDRDLLRESREAVPSGRPY